LQKETPGNCAKYKELRKDGLQKEEERTPTEAAGGNRAADQTE
jgi:hypothetical protein